jgi:hypothetical protein
MLVGRWLPLMGGGWVGKEESGTGGYTNVEDIYFFFFCAMISWSASQRDIYVTAFNFLHDHNHIHSGIAMHLHFLPSLQLALLR